ncbi:MAG: hypothetical protein ACPG7F_11955 [Aggregatilineales bacterium]
MTKWEYCYIEVPVTYSGNTSFLSAYCFLQYAGQDDPEKHHREHLMTLIADLGEAGWEMVNYTCTPHQKPSNYFFKRPKS